MKAHDDIGVFRGWLKGLPTKWDGKESMMRIVVFRNGTLNLKEVYPNMR
ncbi:MAG: hypothetical protein ACR2PR_00765 [Pseudohongiellaceae bacterium]